MKLYRAGLTPQSRFVTPMKGDTLFGQLCWSIVHLFGTERLKSLLEDYEESPFLVVSDGFAPGYLPKPSLPGKLLGEKAEEKKANRKKVWLTPEELERGLYAQARSDKEAGYLEREVLTMHNSLNYRTFRTDKGVFAPYGAVERDLNGREIYLLLDTERLSAEELLEALSLVGQAGYGKESGIGRGRFELDAFEEAFLPVKGRSFMALSPLSLEGIDARCWYEPFSRFGKHGDARARKSPFKRPLLLADRGTVVHFEEEQEHCYIGRGLRGVSPAHPDTVHQGYAIVTAIAEVQR